MVDLLLPSFIYMRPFGPFSPIVEVRESLAAAATIFFILIIILGGAFTTANSFGDNKINVLNLEN